MEVAKEAVPQTFWGKAWYKHLGSFSDPEKRLPVGRTLLRSGSVRHLEVGTGIIRALVCDTDLVRVEIYALPIPWTKWIDLKQRCAGRIHSREELLQGRLNQYVESIVTDKENGLFPLFREIEVRCDCPDWAGMCKHAAAALYGVAVRLDQNPEILFNLRGMNPNELVTGEIGAAGVAMDSGKQNRIDEHVLDDYFDIEIEDSKSVYIVPPRNPKKSIPAFIQSVRPEEMEPQTMNRSMRKPDPRQGEGHAGRILESRLDSDGASRSFPSDDGDMVTGKDVYWLRRKFNMTPKEFASLLGVRPETIYKWEKKPGALTFRSHSRDAWMAVKDLTKREARQQLKLSQNLVPANPIRKS